MKLLSSILREMSISASKIVRENRLELIDLVIGLKYAIAIVEGPEGKAAGLCFVDYLDLHADPPILEVRNLDELLNSPYHLWRVAGVAIANAAFQYDLWIRNNVQGLRIEDVGNQGIKPLLDELMSRQPVLIVGNMVPIVNYLCSKGVEVFVVERNPLFRYKCLTDASLKFVVKKAKSAIVTGASIPNGTIDELLELLRSAKFIVVVGPTAQLDPRLLHAKGVNAVASSRVIDISRALEIVKRGGGRHDLPQAMRDYIAYPISPRNS